MKTRSSCTEQETTFTILWKEYEKERMYIKLNHKKKKEKKTESLYYTAEINIIL